MTFDELRPVILTILLIAAFSLSIFSLALPAVLGIAAVTVTTLYSLELGLLGLLVLTPFDVVGELPGGILVESSEIQFGVFLTVCLFSRQVSILNYKVLNDRLFLWGGPFLAVLALALLVNLPLHKVVPHMLRQAELLVSLAVASVVIARYGRRKLPIAINSLAILVTLLAIVQFPGLRGRSWSSVFGNPNQLAGFLVLLIPILYVVQHEAGWSNRWVRLTPLTLALIALGGTFSRAAVLSLVVGLFTALCLSRRSVRGFLSEVAPIALLLTLFSTAVILFAVGVGQRDAATRLVSRAILPALSSERIAASLGQRFFLLSLGLSIVREHPFLGIGPGRYSNYAEELLGVHAEEIRRRILDRSEQSGTISQAAFEQSVDREVARVMKSLRTHTHNLPLQLAVDFGVLAPLTFLLLLGRLGVEMRKSAPSAPSGIWAFSGLWCLSAYITHNLLDVTFPSLGLETGLLLGITLGAIWSLTDTDHQGAELEA